MLQAILHGAGDLRLEERPLDPNLIASGQVYIETEVTALSTGTDLGNFEGRSREVPDAPDYPRAVGYSNVGRVARVGKDIKQLQPGQRVFSMRPHLSAFIAQEAELLVPVPESVSSEQASLGYLIELGGRPGTKPVKVSRWWVWE
jgi:NADPH:quinone reductase-like Zn-dependent oxidoreductase